MTGILGSMFFGQPFGGLIPGARGAVLAVLLRTGEPLTGRQVHGLLSQDHSLWSVQEALKALGQLGLVETQQVGRAGVHTINEGHVTIGPLRALVDPIGALKSVVRETVGADAQAVILFGSLARGETNERSDVDLAVIAADGWDGRAELEDAVLAGLGNDCDVLVFTDAEFRRALVDGARVVEDIYRDGVVLYGTKPRVRRRVA